MTRTNPRVDIKSTTQIPRAAKESETALARLNAASKKHFGEGAKHALGYGAAIVGGAGVVGALEASVGASLAAEKAQAKLDAQLKAVGISYKAHSKQIDDVVAKTSQYSGFLDKDLQGALANIVRSTGSLGESYKLLGLATDVARTKNIDVASAGQMVGRVYAGNTRVLKSLGISMDPVTKATDALKASTKHATAEQVAAAKAEDKRATTQSALALLQQKLGGQAKAYGETTSGSLDKMKAAVDRLEVKLGKALAPTIRDVADKVSKFVTQLQTGEGAGGRFAKTMENVGGTLKDVLTPVVDVAKWLAKHPQLLAAAGAAWVAYKTAAIGQIAIVKAAELGLFGAGVKGKIVGEAEGAGTQVGKGFAAKAGLAAAAGIAGWEIGSWLRKNVGPVRDAGNFLGKQFADALGMGGPNNLQQKIDNAIGAAGQRQSQANANPPSPGHGVIRPHGHAKPKAGGAVAHGSAVARASASPGAGVRIAGAASVGVVTGDIGGLQAGFLHQLQSMASGTGQPISVQSGFRSAAQQEALVQAKGIWSPSNPTGAAPVGSSMHEKGLAADITPGRERFGSVCAKYGLSFPIGAEPWHCQPSGSGGTSSPSSASATTVAAKSVSKKITPYDRLQNTLTHIGLLGDAGVISAGAVDTRKIAAITKALGVKGAIKGDNRLRAMADRRTARGDLRSLAPKKPTPFHPSVDRTLNNPWLQAEITHIDDLVAAGQLTPEQGNAKKTQILQNAINAKKGLKGEDVLVAQGMIQSFAPQSQAPLSAYDQVESGLGDVDLHVRAGDESDTQGVKDKIGKISDALAHPTGLSDHDILELRAELGDLKAQLKDSTDNTAELTQATKDLANQLKTQNEFAQQVMATSLGTVWKALADLVSGQIVGVGFNGRQLTAGSGAIATY